MEKGMATHCRILAWRIPWIEEPGGLRSMGSQRVGHNLASKQQYGQLNCLIPGITVMRRHKNSQKYHTGYISVICHDQHSRTGDFCSASRRDIRELLGGDLSPSQGVTLLPSKELKWQMPIDQPRMKLLMTDIFTEENTQVLEAGTNPNF